MRKLGIVMLIGAAAFTGDCAAASARTTDTRSTYNGRWSVAIITEQGSCDRGYRYPIDINNGVLHYEGDVVEISGQVARTGAVRVTVSRGNQQAVGQGHLDRNSGQGVWSSAASNNACSGRWEAERR